LTLKERNMSQLPNSELPMSQLQNQLPNQLQLQPNFNEPGKRYFRDFTPGDDFYEALIDTHRDLTDEQSALVNAKLILLLANHVGDLHVLREAMALARADVVPLKTVA
jgi:hypothetical protein